MNKQDTPDNDIGFEPDSDSLNRVFSAIADPVRREILRMLDEKDCLVSELAKPFEMSLQAVSKHIQVLVRAGLIEQERTGRISRCRLTAGPIYEAAVWVNRYSKYWQTQFDTLVSWLDEIESERTTPESDPEIEHTTSKSNDKTEEI